MPTYRQIDFGFSTADGEDVRLEFNGDEIQFSFRDWQEKPIHFKLSGVLAFSWGEAEFLDIPEIRGDVTYEVLDSDLIQKYRAANLLMPTEEYRHFKFCFNASGVFDVLCTGISVATAGSIPNRL